MKRLTIAVVTLVAFFAAVNTYAVNPSTMHKHQTKV